jgi:hypothetical protein
MTACYKTTRVDGKDFATGTIDYAAALASGEVVRHPAAKKIKDNTSTYLSVSVSAADCTGASWPCRLFRVEPVGRVMSKLSVSPNKRAVSALRVVEELPAHLSLGPNGEAVAEFIERCKKLSATDWEKVAAARGAARGAAWGAARGAASGAAWGAAWGAARVAASGAAWGAAWGAARVAARGAASGAASAITTRDLITIEQYNLLTQPFVDAGFAEMVGR